MSILDREADENELRRAPKLARWVILGINLFHTLHYTV